MTIKLIAVDMDGTFLDDDMKYNEKKFMQLYKKMKENNVTFVVASGNQYYQLKSFFAPIQNEISFVAENGAFVLHQNEELFSVDLKKRIVSNIIEILTEIKDISYVVCGKESAYTLASEREEFIEEMNRYYHRLKVVENFEQLDDKILKFALTCPANQTEMYVKQLSENLKGLIKPVSSGNGYIDLIDSRFNKSTGLNILQRRLNISDDEILVFGDGGNDLEMLQMTPNSYAMKNGSRTVKKVANHIAPSNNDEGVLTIIERYV